MGRCLVLKHPDSLEPLLRFPGEGVLWHLPHRPGTGAGTLGSLCQSAFWQGSERREALSFGG